MLSAIRQIVIGNPLASSQIKAERLGLLLAFAVVSANAISSVAYGSEEILLALRLQGDTWHGPAIYIAVAITALVGIIVLGYDRVIHGYPTGGGAYVVAKENLGTMPGLIAGASLLVDYVLTVSVSVTAGAAALGSAFPSTTGYHTVIAILLVVILTLMNLRGTRQSAQMVALPVYFFIGSFLLMIAMGLYRYFIGGVEALPAQPLLPVEFQILGLFVILRAFSSGAVVLTGVEAVSNAMGVFRAPETRNARTTLILMGVLLALLFLGVTGLAVLLDVRPTGSETLVSQVARASLGKNALYYLLQVSTLLILVLAANTSFAAFPQLAAKLAPDGFLPRPLANVGDRLVYSNGIFVLAGFSILLILIFQGNTHHLLPLYAIGVFIGFTLTQAGIAVHWWRRRGHAWLRGAVISGFGAGVTAVVLLVLTVGKFTAGAWMVAIAIPLLILLFLTIRNHYRVVAQSLSLEEYVHTGPATGNFVVVPVGGVNRVVLPALDYARLIGSKVQAIHIAASEDAAQVVERRWERLQTDIPLIVIPSPYREVLGPLVQYIQEIVRSHPSEHVTVVIPEFVPKHWWQHLLHNNTALLLKLALLSERRVVVISVPYQLPE